MKIRELVHRKKNIQFDIWKKGSLQTDSNVYYAVDLFKKSKTKYLPVYENGAYYGELGIFDILEILIEDYRIEKGKRFQMSAKLNGSLTKIKTLVEKAAKSKNQLDQEFIYQQLNVVTNDAQDLLDNSF